MRDELVDVQEPSTQAAVEQLDQAIVRGLS